MNPRANRQTDTLCPSIRRNVLCSFSLPASMPEGVYTLRVQSKRTRRKGTDNLPPGKDGSACGGFYPLSGHSPKQPGVWKLAGVIPLRGVLKQSESAPRRGSDYLKLLIRHLQRRSAVCQWEIPIHVQSFCPLGRGSLRPPALRVEPHYLAIGCLPKKVCTGPSYQGLQLFPYA